MHSYWEYKAWFEQADHVIIGSGIVGLQTALNLRKKFPNSRILILEKGYFPSGASSKNAGFACFGSPSEILYDLKRTNPEEVANLVEMRVRGLEQLKSTCGMENIQFEQFGSHELFTSSEVQLYHDCMDNLDEINHLLFPIFNESVFISADERIRDFGFKQVDHLIQNTKEGQIDTGKMIRKLIQLSIDNNIDILNGIEVTNLADNSLNVEIEVNQTFVFKAKKVYIANNGFAAKLLPNLNVLPARAQVLITNEIDNLKLKGTYHMMEGYYYFRNIGNRILFGGGRNLDFEGETTTQLETTKLIQDDLENKLRTIILTDSNFEIDMRWAGVMGVGNYKSPIVKQISENVFCGVRMGGMGVAIGSLIGKQLSELGSAN
ncbi:MAG: FAD-binding oxidoreductase [Flavobacteriales bacterium]|nr:FAD-binding oxidoreductase [Flavobacteriales bacterium]MCB9198277.1 FAD-binding oxidoreductase [Flavobacteriales bacterium]